MFRLLGKSVPLAQHGSRLLSTLVQPEFKLISKSSVPLQSLFQTSSRTLYKTDITPLQMRLLEQYKNAFIIPPQAAKQLENVRILDPSLSIEEMKFDSVLRKRRLKMKKHKLRKRRKVQRALRRKLKKD